MLWLRLPEKVYFKKGCLPVALQELTDVMNKKRVFIVTDKFLYQNGYVNNIINILSIDFEPMKGNYRSWHRIVQFNNGFTGAVTEAMAASVRATLEKAVDGGQITSAKSLELGGLISRAYAEFAQTPMNKSQGGRKILALLFVNNAQRQSLH